MFRLFRKKRPQNALERTKNIVKKEKERSRKEARKRVFRYYRTRGILNYFAIIGFLSVTYSIIDYYYSTSIHMSPRDMIFFISIFWLVVFAIIFIKDLINPHGFSG